MIKLAATPIRTVMFRPVCAYCGKPEKHWEICDIQLAILACGDPEHQAWAERDAKAWLGRTKCVHPQDYRLDPLFEQTDLLSIDIAVKRTSGEIELDGWVIRRPYYDDAALIRFYTAEDLWLVPVTNAREELNKQIPVRELKLSLPEEMHGLVDAFELRLINGFYTRQMEAHEEAVEAQKEMENPGYTWPRTEIADCFEYRLDPVHGPMRVFSPPLVQVAPAEVDPSST
jgi:hypothetical protein